jgi:uncharacterized membrane protein (UPF0127 family)
MKQKKILLTFKGKKFPLVLNVVPMSLIGLGLMFKRKTNAKVLLFEFKKDVKMKIHSFFVWFPFVAIWLDSRGKIIEIKKVKSWNIGICPPRKYKSLIEIPISSTYDEVLSFIDGIGKI